MAAIPSSYSGPWGRTERGRGAGEQVGASERRAWGGSMVSGSFLSSREQQRVGTGRVRCDARELARRVGAVATGEEDEASFAVNPMAP